MQSYSRLLKTKIFIVVSVAMVSGCYTPASSQKYFVKASKNDPALEPIYSTSLYTVYFDYALSRCVIHSTHTWGQSGGGGGGTGIGIAAFRCDPSRVRNRAEGLGLTTFPPKMSPVVTQPGPRRAPAVQSAPAPAPAPATPGGAGVSAPTGLSSGGMTQ